MYPIGSGDQTRRGPTEADRGQKRKSREKSQRDGGDFNTAWTDNSLLVSDNVFSNTNHSVIGVNNISTLPPGQPAHRINVETPHIGKNCSLIKNSQLARCFFPCILKKRTARGDVMFRIAGLTLRPYQSIARMIELHQLRRRMPFAYRRLISISGGVRKESDAEYLARLREMHTERRKTRAMKHGSGTGGGEAPTGSHASANGTAYS